ncbi:hypothetical protein [Hymenobacter sp. BT491]|uniref:hypothetical protein n=1 Tax=Hymenobacter sp. BT491 TaxID=2766779 RepID=UPI001653C35D|nr:hypothetical protein [Hymenobacter sp. BT491]MBC6988572.1 hypothetical protein [Hymenobacter sp. BT491]
MNALNESVFPSEQKTILCVATDSKFKGAHNYYVQPMVGYQDGAVYGAELVSIPFVKRNEDGTWQPGVQTEQLLLLLKDRHEKLNEVFPSEDHAQFIAGIDMALEALEKRVRERTQRGVMGQLQK